MNNAKLSELQLQASRDVEDYFSFEVEFEGMLPGGGKGDVRCRVRYTIDVQLLGCKLCLSYLRLLYVSRKTV